jgi:hypothetical protein
MASEDTERVVDEEIWRAWIQKGKLRDLAAARTGRILLGIALLAFAVGIALYFLGPRSAIG